MELLQLKYFKAVAKNMNLTQTASALFISPSSLSATISRLEKELGIQLFDRKSNKLILNANGELFLKYTNQILETLDNAIREVQTLDAGQENLLMIATTSPNVWIELFATFQIQHPEIRITHTALKLDDLHSPNILNQYDLILASPGDAPSHWTCREVLYNDDYPVLLVHPDHPLSKRRSISLTDVRNDPFIALSPGFSSRKYFDTLCAMAGFCPQIALECDYMMRSYMIMKKIGVAVATAYTNYARLHDGTCCIDIDDPVLPREQALFYSHKKYQNLAVKTFMTFAQEFYPGKSCHRPPAFTGLPYPITL